MADESEGAVEWAPTAWGAASIAPPVVDYAGHVWHYTDAGGLAGIVAGGPSRTENVRGCLWATAGTMLNDPDELGYGAQRVVEWFGRHGGGDDEAALSVARVIAGLHDWILDNPAYVVSTSTDGDSLGQWRGYAGAGGYAVEIDIRHRWTVWGRPERDASISWAPAWVRVAYTPDEQDALMRRYFDFIWDDRGIAGGLMDDMPTDDAAGLIRALLSGLASALKHPSFAAEREVRLIAFRPEGVMPRFRGSSRGVVPYLEMVPTSPGADSPLQAVDLPVRSIRVGPPRGDLMTQRARSTRILLDSTGRTDAAVHESGIPFIP